MAQTSGGCRSVFKFGCLGCLALVFLVAVITAIVFGVAWNEVRNEEVEKVDLTQTLAAGESLGIEDGPLEVPTEFVNPQTPAGRVVLDLRHTKFDIVPAPPGEPLLVEAKFDVNQYTLSDSYDEGFDDEGWTYEVSFRRTTDSYFFTVLKELLGGTKPRVRISLPSDVPFDLEASFMQGGAEVELGGLWLTNADIEFLQGGGALGISEPLREPVEKLRVAFTQGGGAVEGLGNASPRNLEVGFSMGGGYVDLRGPWQRDAEIDIDQSMGGVTVHLPQNVVIRGIDKSHVDSQEESDDGPPVLRFSTSSNMGELEFIQ